MSKPNSKSKSKTHPQAPVSAPNVDYWEAYRDGVVHFPVKAMHLHSYPENQHWMAPVPNRVDVLKALTFRYLHSGGRLRMVLQSANKGDSSDKTVLEALSVGDWEKASFLLGKVSCLSQAEWSFPALTILNPLVVAAESPHHPAWAERLESAWKASETRSFEGAVLHSLGEGGDKARVPLNQKEKEALLSYGIITGSVGKVDYLGQCWLGSRAAWIDWCFNSVAGKAALEDAVDAAGNGWLMHAWLRIHASTHWTAWAKAHGKKINPFTFIQSDTEWIGLRAIFPEWEGEFAQNPQWLESVLAGSSGATTQFRSWATDQRLRYQNAENPSNSAFFNELHAKKAIESLWKKINRRFDSETNSSAGVVEMVASEPIKSEHPVRPTVAYVYPMVVDSASKTVNQKQFRYPPIFAEDWIRMKSILSAEIHDAIQEHTPARWLNALANFSISDMTNVVRHKTTGFAGASNQFQSRSIWNIDKVSALCIAQSDAQRENALSRLMLFDGLIPSEAWSAMSAVDRWNVEVLWLSAFDENGLFALISDIESLSEKHHPIHGPEFIAYKSTVQKLKVSIDRVISTYLETPDHQDDLLQNWKKTLKNTSTPSIKGNVQAAFNLMSIPFLRHQVAIGHPDVSVKPKSDALAPYFSLALRWSVINASINKSQQPQWGKVTVAGFDDYLPHAAQSPFSGKVALLGAKAGIKSAVELFEKKAVPIGPASWYAGILLFGVRDKDHCENWIKISAGCHPAKSADAKGKCKSILEEKLYPFARAKDWQKFFNLMLKTTNEDSFFNMEYGGEDTLLKTHLPKIQADWQQDMEEVALREIAQEVGRSSKALPHGSPMMAAPKKRWT